jgi:hypothetical protein
MDIPLKDAKENHECNKNDNPGTSRAFSHVSPACDSDLAKEGPRQRLALLHVTQSKDDPVNPAAWTREPQEVMNHESTSPSIPTEPGGRTRIPGGNMISQLNGLRTLLVIAVMLGPSFCSTHLGATDPPTGWEGSPLGAIKRSPPPAGNPETAGGISMIRLVNDSDVTLELRAATASSWAGNPIRETGSVVTSANLFEPGSNELLATTGLGSTIETYLWLCEPAANHNDEPTSLKLRIKYDRSAQTYSTTNEKIDGYITAASEDEMIGDSLVLRITITPGYWIYIR